MRNAGFNDEAIVEVMAHVALNPRESGAVQTGFCADSGQEHPVVMAIVAGKFVDAP